MVGIKKTKKNNNKFCVLQNKNCIIELDNNCNSYARQQGLKENNIIEKYSNLNCKNYNIKSNIWLGSGTYNSAFKVKTTTNNNVVLRISHKKINSDSTNEELLGLYLQTLFSLNKNMGGFGCPYIGKVFTFGKYKVKDIKSSNNFFKCNNKHCKPILYNSTFNNGVYGIIEHLEGGDLFDRFITKNDSNPYTEKEVAHIAGQLFLALDCIHKHNYAHFDIKIENILLVSKSSDTDIKVIDFGFVNYIPSKPGYIDPDSFGRVGTHGYRAPEISNGYKCNQKADIWSSVITIIYLLLGDYHDLSDVSDNDDVVIPDIFFNIYKNILKTYSKECNDFLRKVLVEDFNKRLSAKEALLHPWLQKNCPLAKKIKK
jgi:serine/threonine protein kinase